MVRLLNNFEGLNEFLVALEDGETLVDVCAKYGVPVESVIEDNGLIGEPRAGEILYIKKHPAKIITPADVISGEDFVFKITKVE